MNQFGISSITLKKMLKYFFYTIKKIVKETIVMIEWQLLKQGLQQVVNSGIFRMAERSGLPPWKKSTYFHCEILGTKVQLYYI